MILTAGLTPAWQQILVFDRFRYGEVNRAAEAHWCSSGKVFNAGIAAHRLGGSSLTLATVGGPPQAEIEREMEQMGVPHRWVVTRAATRVCTTILDRATGTMTELVENGRALAADEVAEFRRVYAEEAGRAEVAVIIGSLPAGVPESLYGDLARCTACPMVLDFRGPGLLSALEFRPQVVKPNREELALTVGRPLATDADLRAAMQELNDRGARWVLITDGPRPAWAANQGRFYRLVPPPAEKIVNPIGCGDAMVATLAWAIRGRRDMLEALRLAMAAAGENLKQLFPCRFDPRPLEEAARQVRVEQWKA